MGHALALLDDALELARREKTALEGGSYDEAIELAQQRGQLADMAWNSLELAESPAYRSRLLELSKIQAQLTQLATKARDAIRLSLNRSRQEKKRIRGYHMAIGQALQ